MMKRNYLPCFQPSMNDFKRHLRITSHDIDAELDKNLKAAITATERHIGQTVATSEFTETFPFNAILPLRTPVIALESVEADGVALTPEQYDLGADDVLRIDVSIVCKKVTVKYQSGMEYVPEDIQAAILLQAAALFDNPVDSVETLAKKSQNLLAPYRKYGMR